MKFSIIVPSYNQDIYLPATLDSIMGQEIHGVEIIVNDGGSTDRSCKILASYGDRISWSTGRDLGQTDAINKGLRKATGEIFGYLNSDDVYLPGSLIKVAEYFDAHPSCDLLYGDAWHLHADGSIMEPYPTEEWNYDRLFKHCYLCQPAVFWRSRIHSLYGYFDERLHYAMDYEFWLRVGAHARIEYFPGQPFAGSRLHADTKTLKSRMPVHREILQVVRQLARQPKDCYTWLRHLAAMEANERGFATSIIPERQKFHEITYASQLLSVAEEYEIELDDKILGEIDQIALRNATP